MKTSNFKQHLYFETQPASKEFQLDKCMKVLSMIAKLKDRNQIISDICEEVYGRSEAGAIRADEIEAAKYKNNIKMIKRLKLYYNYCLSKVKGF